MSRTTENFRLKKTLDINVDCCQDLISLVFICLLDGGRLGLSVCLFFVAVCLFMYLVVCLLEGWQLALPVCLFVCLLMLVPVFICCLFVGGWAIDNVKAFQSTTAPRFVSCNLCSAPIHIDGYWCKQLFF